MNRDKVRLEVLLEVQMKMREEGLSEVTRGVLDRMIAECEPKPKFEPRVTDSEARALAARMYCDPVAEELTLSPECCKDVSAAILKHHGYAQPKPIKMTLEFWKPEDAPLSPDIGHIAAIRDKARDLIYYAGLPTLAQIEEAGA